MPRAQYRTRGVPTRISYDHEACYLGVKACGCAVGAVAPRLLDVRAAARRVAGWMRKGYAIELMSVGQARQVLVRCPHDAVLARQFELLGGR